MEEDQLRWQAEILAVDPAVVECQVAADNTGAEVLATNATTTDVDVKSKADIDLSS